MCCRRRRVPIRWESPHAPVAPGPGLPSRRRGHLACAVAGPPGRTVGASPARPAPGGHPHRHPRCHRHAQPCRHSQLRGRTQRRSQHRRCRLGRAGVVAGAGGVPRDRRAAACGARGGDRARPAGDHVVRSAHTGRPRRPSASHAARGAARHRHVSRPGHRVRPGGQAARGGGRSGGDRRHGHPVGGGRRLAAGAVGAGRRRPGRDR